METTGDSRQESPDPAAAQAVSAVSFRLPQFWPADPSLWLGQVNSQFVTARVTAQTSNFHHMVSALPPEIASEIRHLILAPPETNPYEKLSVELLKRTSSSERQRLQQLLSAEELRGLHSFCAVFSSFLVTRPPRSIRTCYESSSYNAYLRPSAWCPPLQRTCRWKSSRSLPTP
ncbi:hypothetical protein HPB52_001364 [Rhipicephalus sanguineus]|uniref:DUF7041 domain-containing protein n=1 Tax=Rhipicephalus sanguineus TaxID=34632 RepID=A0A9D4PTM2_RHISA|nr:hypothetical protein HPB52_001364 [Rhipicephalus sanguineus]